VRLCHSKEPRKTVSKLDPESDDKFTWGADLYLPALSCCFCADVTSWRTSSPAGCLKTTGAREIVPGAAGLDEESSKLA